MLIHVSSFKFSPTPKINPFYEPARWYSRYYTQFVGVLVNMASAHNCVYGSTLSPPRLEQIQGCIDEYFSHATPSDEYFQFHLPQLIRVLNLGLTLGDEGVDQASNTNPEKQWDKCAQYRKRKNCNNVSNHMVAHNMVLCGPWYQIVIRYLCI